jgi:hypothetical protein
MAGATNILPYIFSYAVLLFFLGFVFIMAVPSVPEFAQNLPRPPVPPTAPNAGTGGTCDLGCVLQSIGNTIYFVGQNIGYFFGFLLFTSGYDWLRILFITPMVIGFIVVLIAIARGVSV